MTVTPTVRLVGRFCLHLLAKEIRVMVVVMAERVLVSAPMNLK